jgi:hypothetical protein
VISTISHDPGVGNDLIKQKWAGKLRLNNKKPIKKLSRVLYGFLYRKQNALRNCLEYNHSLQEKQVFSREYVFRMLTFDSSSDIYMFGSRFNLEVDLGLRISDCGVKMTCEWTECLKPLEAGLQAEI